MLFCLSNNSSVDFKILLFSKLCKGPLHVLKWCKSTILAKPAYNKHFTNTTNVTISVIIGFGFGVGYEVSVK